MLASQFKSVIYVVHYVALNQNTRSTIHVYAVRIRLVAVGRITSRRDVKNQVLAHHSIARSIDFWIGRGAFKADHVDSDVVVIVHDILGNSETSHVSIDHKRFARTCLEMVNFIALDNEIADWRFRVCTVNGDAKAVGSLSRPQLDCGILLYVMHVVLQNFDVRTPSKHPNPAW